jgi:hypothetical protein
VKCFLSSVFEVSQLLTAYESFLPAKYFLYLAFTDLKPFRWRGRLGGFYNTFYFTGAITATGVVYATSQYTTTIAWRLPLALQVIPPFCVFMGSFFIPESPRWLASRGRMDNAAKIIYKLHGGEDNEIAKLEVREVALHVKLSKPQTPCEYIRGLWDYRDLFNTHSARWRTAMVTLITFSSSLTGNTILTCTCQLVSCDQTS